MGSFVRSRRTYVTYMVGIANGNFAYFTIFAFSRRKFVFTAYTSITWFLTLFNLFISIGAIYTFGGTQLMGCISTRRSQRNILAGRSWTKIHSPPHHSNLNLLLLRHKLLYRLLIFYQAHHYICHWLSFFVSSVLFLVTITNFNLKQMNSLLFNLSIVNLMPIHNIFCSIRCPLCLLC